MNDYYTTHLYFRHGDEASIPPTLTPPFFQHKQSYHLSRSFHVVYALRMLLPLCPHTVTSTLAQHSVHPKQRVASSID
jgi:hypothetical protein